MRTPNYIITQDITVYKRVDKQSKSYTLKAGMFVRPISSDYLPSYILEEEDGSVDWMKVLKETYVYCVYGLVKVPWDHIREV